MTKTLFMQVSILFGFIFYCALCYSKLYYMIFQGGGGLVQQLRRSYSLSDLSTDSDMADVNRNSKSKMLTNIPDEDLEETDDVSMDDHRVRRSRGYSPRRSASGSGRVEMYFPEVDVDVRQHGSHSRDPSLTLSQIRSSEDVSSGYSSAEPLYSGHHPTRSEGLAASREPLVRTASVGGASRTARTRTTRGGAVPKRSSPAEVPGFATLPRSKKPSKKKIQ